MSALFETDAEGFLSYGDVVNGFERDVIDVFGLLFDFFWNGRRQALEVRVAEDLTRQGGVYLRAVSERADAGPSGAAVHPAGEEGGTAGHRGQLGLDVGAAAVQDRPIAVVGQNDGTFPVKCKCPAEPGLPDFCLDLRENNNEQN